MSLADWGQVSLILLPFVILLSALLVFGGLEEIRRELRRAREPEVPPLEVEDKPKKK